MSRHKEPTVRKRKVKLPDELDQLVHRVLITNVQQKPVSSGIHEVNATAKPTTGLEIQLNHVRK
jgi:hypothetical protein